MIPRSPILPAKLQKLIRAMKSSRFPYTLSFIIVGLLSTLWFLIRVIPKPSRAAYPCMQATAPFMSAFVLWLISLGGGLLAVKRSLNAFKNAKYLSGLFFFLLSMGAWGLFHTLYSEKGMARERLQSGQFPPNEPIGSAQGIFPGRVVWMWDENATNENCSNTSNGNGIIDDGDDAWFMDHNNNYDAIDSMLGKSMRALTGASNLPLAWEALFTYFNTVNDGDARSYRENEKIFIKVNATSLHGEPGIRYYNDLSRNDDTDVNGFAAETNPYLVLAVLRQLVEEAGIPENMIYVGDPARNIYKEFYDLWHADFPEINYLGNELLHPELDVEALGRTPVAVSEGKLVFWSDEGEVMQSAIDDELFSIFEEMDYLINIPTLKAHSTAGITLAAKNHFGSFTRQWAMHLHTGLFDGVDDPQRLGYGLYRVQTDIMMHKLLSGKNLLILVDGLYPGEDALGVPEKWNMPPFENNWCSSIFASSDPVAIESVCHDFLRTEYNEQTIAESRPNWPGVDDYLHQAASSDNWPDGIIYDPEDDGIIITSLGVHEHWNDSLHKEYTRNLGTGNGIDLVKVHQINTVINNLNPKDFIVVYPNPTHYNVFLRNDSDHSLDFKLFDNNGNMHLSGDLKARQERTLDLRKLPMDMYYLNVSTNNRSYVKKLIILK
ncbi:MAG: DUF362 domain-containing protein [Bacteroidota bacterium]|nr:DUF362 domain-containing protein [Bacteroidota bacterium]